MKLISSIASQTKGIVWDYYHNRTYALKQENYGFYVKI